MGQGLVIGCPFYKRDWIFETWLDHAKEAAISAGFPDPHFVFVLDHDDDEGENFLHSFGGMQVERNNNSYEHSKTDDVGVNFRDWGAERYQEMVDLRNLLLESVAKIEPEYFLSLDSDILIHRDHLSQMIGTLKRGADAVGGLTYLSKTDDITTNAAIFNNNRHTSFRRPTVKSVYMVDVIMALKLMNPSAYTTPYEINKFGEDFGWSLNMRKQRKLLYFDARTASKHVMSPDYLSVKDKRCGY